MESIAESSPTVSLIATFDTDVVTVGKSVGALSTATDWDVVRTGTTTVSSASPSTRRPSWSPLFYYINKHAVYFSCHYG